MFDQNVLATRAAAAKADLNRRGISEKSAPSAHDTLDSFTSNAAPMSLTDLEEHRQLANADVRKGGKEAPAARTVQNVIDDAMNPRNAVSWTNTNPAEAYATLQKARGQALATARLKEIEGLENDAQVGTNVHGTEPSKALRMQFGSALKSDDFMQRFGVNPDLVAQMQSISKGAAGHRKDARRRRPREVEGIGVGRSRVPSDHAIRRRRTCPRLRLEQSR
jgi:hypothetical protein